MSLAIVVAIALLLPKPGPAPEIPGATTLHVEPSPERAEAAERLRREAEDLRRRLAESEGARASLFEQARRLDQEWALRRAEAGSARLAAESESQRAAIAADRARSMTLRVDALRRRAAMVARALYVEGRDAPLVRALAGEESQSSQLGSALVARQADLALDLRRAERAAREAAAESQRRAAASRVALRDAESAESVAQRQSVDRQAALRRLADAVARDRGAAEEKERAAQELLSALSPSEVARRPPPRPSRPQRQIALDGLELLRGRLPWPVDGAPRVLETWGPVRDPVRGTSTFRHGVTLSARRGDPIRAVAPGRVLFVDWYKGFGRCLVLDHGDGFLSVCGHADAFSVAPGDVVDAGEVVGEVGDTGSLSGPCLWFQIQRRGESVDPLQWLRR